ncbi:hypothetical protein [Paucisalibacillus globulus]|uniref:hypothetical protein n=1 Tax=Paucisalibacillus globulus TaxID=351095 RepID=UPI0003F9E374|nr:hypothetical protein [Paucisalibacillus globulus]
MKDDLKVTMQLMKQELKLSWGSFIGLFLYYSLFTVLFTTGFHAQETRFVGLDLFFLMLFIFGPAWFKPKGLQLQKINGKIFASPSTIMGLHLPIKKQVIVLKSIVQYVIHSFPFQLYMLIMLYLISPDVRNTMELDTYISFAIIWLSFGIYIGFSVLTIDVGSSSNNNNLTIVLSSLLFVAILLLILSFPYFFTYGVVEWTIIIAKKWPYISTLLSISAATVGFFYWKKKLMKQLKQIDYL